MFFIFSSNTFNPFKSCVISNGSSITSPANDKIAKALEDGTYFEMPLVRREETSRHSHLLEKGSIGKKIAPYFNDVNDFLDTRELLKEDLDILFY